MEGIGSSSPAENNSKEYSETLIVTGCACRLFTKNRASRHIKTETLLILILFSGIYKDNVSPEYESEMGKAH